MKAVIGENIEEILVKLGVMDDISEHKVHCFHCGQPIDVDNIGVFIPRRNSEGKRYVDFIAMNLIVLAQF